MNGLPEMTVEVREGRNWGLKAPTKPGTEERKHQNKWTTILSQGAKESNADNPWPEKVLEGLELFKGGIEASMYDVPEIMKEFYDYRGEYFPTWRSCVDFVEQDLCVEFAVIAEKYLARMEKLGHATRKQDRDFIDEGGVGTFKRYCDRLARKGDSPGALEKTFDCKAHFKQERPIEEDAETMGIEAAMALACYVHPGHYEYPAGHATKAFEKIDQVDNEWTMKTFVRQNLVVCAYVSTAMSRTGARVHRPEANLAGGYIAGLAEFAHYGE